MAYEASKVKFCSIPDLKKLLLSIFTFVFIVPHFLHTSMSRIIFNCPAQSNYGKKRILLSLSLSAFFGTTCEGRKKKEEDCFLALPFCRKVLLLEILDKSDAVLNMESK